MMHETDIQHMRHALSLAHKAESEGEVPVGALIVHDNKIIAEGWNQPIQLHDPTAHAEMLVLRQASHILNNYRLNHATLYVTLEPCIMCVGAMIHARIHRVVFGAWDPKAGAVHSVFQVMDDVRHNHAISWQGGVCAEDCGNVLKAFFQKRRL